MHTQKCTNNTGTAIETLTDTCTQADLQMCTTYREAQGTGKNTHAVTGTPGWTPTERCRPTSAFTDTGGQTCTNMDTPVILILKIIYIWTFTDTGRNVQTHIFKHRQMRLCKKFTYTHVQAHVHCYTLTPRHMLTHRCAHMYLINSCTDR